MDTATTDGMLADQRLRAPFVCTRHAWWQDAFPLLAGMLACWCGSADPPVAGQLRLARVLPRCTLPWHRAGLPPEGPASGRGARWIRHHGAL